jgi:hypothetical protein
MVPTFIADRSTGAAPSFAPAACHEYAADLPHGLRAGHEIPATESPSPPGTARTASRPTSARLEPMPRLRGFSHWFALTAPSRLACRTQAVWRYQPVPSLSGLLPPAPCASKARLPPASTTGGDGPPLDLSLHSIIDASWRTSCSQHNRASRRGGQLQIAGSRPIGLRRPVRPAFPRIPCFPGTRPTLSWRPDAPSGLRSDFHPTTTSADHTAQSETDRRSAAFTPSVGRIASYASGSLRRRCRLECSR